MLRCINGLEKYNGGSITVEGKEIAGLSQKELQLVRKDMGMIFQNFNLLGRLNVYDNIAFGLKLKKEPKDIIEQKVKRMLKLVNLEEFADRSVTAMSGGQQQRVGIARALVVHPEIIFADEPTGNLDSHTTMDVLKLMQRIVREQNQTLVMVTHDNHLAAYADRIFHIIDGKIVKIEENRQMGKEDGKIEEI